LICNVKYYVDCGKIDDFTMIDNEIAARVDVIGSSSVVLGWVSLFNYDFHGQSGSSDYISS
ncbi:hypothetical protein R6Q59_001684, partial [Mikania micrantha]